MGIHNINATNKPVKQYYPPIAESKLRHIQDQLSRNTSWSGNHECVVSLFGKFTWTCYLSHTGVQKLRSQKITISYANKLTLRDNIAGKYEKGIGFSF